MAAAAAAAALQLGIATFVLIEPIWGRQTTQRKVSPSGPPHLKSHDREQHCQICLWSSLIDECSFMHCCVYVLSCLLQSILFAVCTHGKPTQRRRRRKKTCYFSLLCIRLPHVVAMDTQEELFPLKQIIFAFVLFGRVVLLRLIRCHYFCRLLRRINFFFLLENWWRGC